MVVTSLDLQSLVLINAYEDCNLKDYNYLQPIINFLILSMDNSHIFNS